MELYLKLIEVLFPVFFIVGIGYFLGKKNPKFDTTFITNYSGNFGAPALFIFAITSSADVYKIDSNNGNIIWSRNTAGSLYANATDFFKLSEIILSNNRIFFSSGNNSYMLNADTGSTIWKNDVSSSGTPIVDEENIFLVTENGYFIILNKNTGEIISSSNTSGSMVSKFSKRRISVCILYRDDNYF